jgi:hypothetical protein
MPAAIRPHRLYGATFDEAAACLAVRNHYDLAGIEDTGDFRHEPHAGKGDYVTLELARLARQLQAVTHHVGQFLNLRFLVMVREQNGPARLLQVDNFIRNAGNG